MDGRLSRLSETERRIAALVAAGRTNEQIAQQLLLSAKTLEWSLAKIFRKLVVRSRAELAATVAPASGTRFGAAKTPANSPRTKESR